MDYDPVDILAHIGTPHEGAIPHSGRYEYGSGDQPFQRTDNFLGTIAYLQNKGMTEKEIAQYFGMSQNQLRQRKSVEKDSLKQEKYDQARKLIAEAGGDISLSEVARRIGVKDSTLRGWFKDSIIENSTKTDVAAETIKEAMKRHPYIDVGKGSETMLGISETKMKTVIQKLVDEEGYVVKNLRVQQLGTDLYTTALILCPPGTTIKDLMEHGEDIGLVTEYPKYDNTGYSVLGLQKPSSIDSDRIQIRYGEEGGTAKDGVIELRRGVDELSMGGANYAQVRIAVDDSMYLKGMAVYTDDLPNGIDIRFNTNKSQGTPLDKVLKPMQTDNEGNIDWDNPFGSLIKSNNGQRTYIDQDGNEQLSPVNIVREQGDWDTWSKTLASQFLSKQPKALVQQQLGLTYDYLKDEYDDIMKLESPELKKQLLQDFAAKCDSNAVNLKAASLPRQSTKVILPLDNIKPDEIYAPTYDDGESVALIRYPHGGIFEIPVLKVNNHNKSGDAVIGKQSIDAVGISTTAAQQLSGADFDGDTVVVIPMHGQKIKTSSPLAGLKGFSDIMGDLYSMPEPKYSSPEEAKRDKERRERNKQKEMGIATNLVNDMTIKGATEEELARAVRYTMVVIDSVKHNLDVKAAKQDNKIDELKRIYQDQGDGTYGGSSTLISRAKSPARVNERKASKLGPDPETGEKRYYETGRTKKYQAEDGTWVDTGKPVQTKTTKMDLAKDARELLSVNGGTVVERLYADYANKCKALANLCRKEALAIKMPKQDKAAKEKYAAEVESINNKIKIAALNKPLERQAQLLGNAIVRSKKLAFPEYDGDDDWLAKIKRQALSSARAKTGADKKASQIKLTDKEWEAISKRAVSSTTINTILASADRDHIRKLATPRTQTGLSQVKINRIRNLAQANCSLKEIADEMGLPLSTISQYTGGKGEAS